MLLIGGHLTAPGPSDEDELFEAGIVSTNEVYRLHEEEGLQRVAECSGTLLTHQILTPQQVINYFALIHFKHLSVLHVHFIPCAGSTF